MNGVTQLSDLVRTKLTALNGNFHLAMQLNVKRYHTEAPERSLFDF